LVVKWPSGLKEVFESPQINQFLKIIENDCAYPGKYIFSDGITKICSGDSLQLIAPAGDTYLWSNGETSQEIQIVSGGIYTVTVTNEGGCTTISSPISIIQDPDETPIVSSSGPLTFCSGGAIFLYSSEAESYLWSTGFPDTVSSLFVFESGIYSVTVPGFCYEFTSDPVLVTVVDIPPIPQVENDTIESPGEVTLSAIGNNVKWYYGPNDDDPFWTGNELEISIGETTIFYVEAENEVNGVICESDRVEVWGVVEIIATKNINEFENIEVYPNPANREVIVDFKNGIPSKFEISISDISGRLIYTKRLEENNTSFKHSIPLLNIPSGFYSLLIGSETNIYVQKMIVQKD